MTDRYRNELGESISQEVLSKNTVCMLSYYTSSCRAINPKERGQLGQAKTESAWQAGYSVSVSV